MNKRLKRNSWVICSLSLSLAFAGRASADEARDCKQMQVAQVRLQTAAKLLTRPSSNPERVDIRSEYAAFNIAGIKLRVLGANNRCGSSLTRVTPENVTVQYTSALSNARQDQFELSKEREILSWRHVNKKGTATSYKFGPSGEVVALTESSIEEENL